MEYVISWFVCAVVYVVVAVAIEEKRPSGGIVLVISALAVFVWPILLLADVAGVVRRIVKGKES